MGLVNYVSSHPNQKNKKDFDEKFIVSKFESIATSANSLKLNSIQYAHHLQPLLLKNTIPRRKSRLKVNLL